MERFVSHSTAETEKYAEKLAQTLKSGDVIAYFGGMGMGKTAFTRGLAKGLGCTGEVASPTFSLVNEYAGELPLYHFDMYRVNTYEDLYTTGFFDYLEQKGVLAVEWSENIEEALPQEYIKITISRISDNEREISVERVNTAR